MDRVVPSSGKSYVRENCIYSRNALKSSLYLYPYRSSFPCKQSAYKEDEEGGNKEG